MKITSFASALHAENKIPKVNFRTLFNEENVEDADFVLPKENVEMAHARFANSLVGFFVGKRVAFPLVQNYVNNTWSKFGFQSMIKDYDDVYYFKFTSLTGLEQGRIGYARDLIKVIAGIDLKKEVTMDVPLLTGEGHVKDKMVVEYDWTPSRCDDCKVFGHLTHDCPKRVLEPVEKGETSLSAGNIQSKVAKSNAYTSDEAPKTISTKVQDSFSLLSMVNQEDTDWETNDMIKEPSGVLNESDSDDVEEFIIEGPDRRRTNETELAGASTPIDEVIMENKLSVCAILESHVVVSNLDKLCSKVFIHWDWYECTAGSSRLDIAMREFKACVEEIEVMDVQCTGLQFTWNQKPKGGDGILKKIDRILGDLEFNESFFLPKPFKFNNILAHHVKLKDVVSEGWASIVSGFCMFKVVKKLKILKKPLRKLLYAHGNIHKNVTRLRTEVDNAQKDLDTDPFNLILREQEVSCVNAYNEALILQERFLKQRAKIQWLKEGDSNSAYFHKAVKSRVSRSRIDVVTNSCGTAFENDQVKEAMFSMGNDKSPGSDGYATAFFKEAWDVVGTDVVLAVKEFFVNDRDVARCAFNVDIQKAYDMVDWEFLKVALIGFGFHEKMITWIMECEKVRNSDFKYHRYCEDMELINLCFADDLFLFAHGDDKSAKLIMEASDEFKLASRLTPSLPKSTTYFCNVLNCAKLAILQIMPFEEGRLPVKYLGVPLVPSRLVYKDCKDLIENVDSRINDWKNKSLLIAGKMSKGKSKVAWEVVCLPKDEGGLGVKRLDLFNKAPILEWLHELVVKHRILNSLNIPNVAANVSDKLEWRFIFGVVESFTVSKVWQTIRPRDGKVTWENVVWFSNCIPRHAFNLWLIMKRRLKTRDNLTSWDLASSMGNPLPKTVGISAGHGHLRYFSFIRFVRGKRGTPAGRVILFGTIPTYILDITPIVTPPAAHIDTTLIPVEIPTVLDPDPKNLNSVPSAKGSDDVIKPKRSLRISNSDVKLAPKYTFSISKPTVGCGRKGNKKGGIMGRDLKKIVKDVEFDDAESDDSKLGLKKRKLKMEMDNIVNNVEKLYVNKINIVGDMLVPFSRNSIVNPGGNVSNEHRIDARKKGMEMGRWVPMQGMNTSGNNKLPKIHVIVNKEGNNVVDMDPLLEEWTKKWDLTLLGSIEGMCYVLENEPWLVEVPLEAWNTHGISRFASSLGNPIIIDEITASMCEKAYGRANFARVLIEIDVTKELADSIEVCYSSMGKSMKLRVIYAWKPPLYTHFKVFGHDFKNCSVRQRMKEEKNERVNDKEQDLSNGVEDSLKANEGWQHVRRLFKNVASTSNKSGHQNSFRTDGGYRGGYIGGCRCGMYGIGNMNGRGGLSRGRGGMYQKENNGRLGTKFVPVRNTCKRIDNVHVMEDNVGGSNVDKGKKIDNSKSRNAKKVVERDRIYVKSSFSVLNDEMFESGGEEWVLAKGKIELAVELGLRWRIAKLQKDIAHGNTYAFGKIYDDIHREELIKINDLQIEKQKAEVKLFFYSKEVMTRDTWIDEMILQYEGLMGEKVSKIMNESLQGSQMEFMDDEVAEDIFGIAKLMARNEVSNVDDGNDSEMEGAWVSNSVDSRKGCRIVVGWDPAVFTPALLSQSSQVMYFLVKRNIDGKEIYVSFVYGEINAVGRRDLWKNIKDHNSVAGSFPWVLLGDFNAIVNYNENCRGIRVNNVRVHEFRDCVEAINIKDVKMTGLFFTRIQKRKDPNSGILKKLDRVMGNGKFVDEYINGFTNFLPFGWEREFEDLASKIRNIEGRVTGNEGQLRQAFRNVNKTTPGTYVTLVSRDNSTKAPSLSMEGGTNNKAVKPPVENVTNNMATKNQSFASMFKKPIVSKAARLSVMKSAEVPGANVAIPLAEVEIISKRFENTLYRVLTEVSSLTPLLESVVVAVPFLDGSSHSFETVKVEYEWQPPRCDTCKIFDHVDNDCPKRVKEVVAPDSTNDDGSTKVTRKQGKCKHSSKSRQVVGVKPTKRKPSLQYRPIGTTNTSNATNKNTGESSSSHTSHVDTVQVDACPTKSNDLNLSNSFGSLDNDDEEFWTHSSDLNNATLNVINESDSEDVDEELVVECDNRNVTLGASTPINEVLHD
nr:hypothetical protein [Tanacetum cinerariifolium]